MVTNQECRGCADRLHEKISKRVSWKMFSILLSIVMAIIAGLVSYALALGSTTSATIERVRANEIKSVETTRRLDDIREEQRAQGRDLKEILQRIPPK